MIKKIIFLSFFLILVINILYAKKIVLTIDNQKYELDIADNTNDAELQIISFFKAYIQTKNNFEKMKAIQEKTQKQLKETALSLDEMIAQNNILLDLVDNRPNKKLTIFRPSIFLGATYSIDKEFSILVGPSVTLFEWVGISVIIEAPDLAFGLLLHVYLK